MFLTLSPLVLFSQEKVPQSLSVEFFDHNDGLIASPSFHQYLDSRGFLWAGSWGGLNRFDGKNVVQYGPRDSDEPDPGGIEINGRICEDKQANIWFASENGLHCYIREANDFITFTLDHDPEKIYWLCGIDSINQLWVHIR